MARARSLRPRATVPKSSGRQSAAVGALAISRLPLLDTVRGAAVVWMTAFHFTFDLNHFGFIQQDFYRDPVWTVQRTCILSLFLLCAGFGQALAVHAGQTWARFWRRWAQIALCALAVSVGSALMFANSWIYFGVLHGMAVMLLVCRATAGWGSWLWVLGAAAIGLGVFAADLHVALSLPQALDAKGWNWLGLISRKPVTEDYVPVLPWLGVMWWGMALGQWVLTRGAGAPVLSDRVASALSPLAWVGRWSLSWYMLHQPILIGGLTLLVALKAQ
jgi:uncharacterized membrane protein